MKLSVYPIKRFMILAILLLGGLAPLPKSVHANPVEEAKSFYTLGQTQYEKGLYSEAITSFLEADKLAPAALMDFNIALSYEALGQNENAIKHYEQFLTRSNDEALIAEVKGILTGLKAPQPASQSDGPTASSPNHKTNGVGEEASEPSQIPREDGTDLERVRSIEVSSIREQRRYLIESSKSKNTAEESKAIGAASLQDKNGNAIVGGNNTPVTTKPQNRGNDFKAERRQSFQNQPALAKENQKKSKAKPIYKNVLFWVVL